MPYFQVLSKVAALQEQVSTPEIELALAQHKAKLTDIATKYAQAGAQYQKATTSPAYEAALRAMAQV